MCANAFALCTICVAAAALPTPAIKSRHRGNVWSTKCLGFKRRQIRNIMANKGTRYEGKIVGDSPEMYRALDSHGFADLKAATMAYSAYTSVLPIGDARRFNLGTPNEVLRSVERAFAVAPTSKRIVEDILVLPMALDRIIEHKGIVVEDEALRHGRRLSKHKTSESLKPNKKPLLKNPQYFQRIETLASTVPPHLDVQEARKILSGMAALLCFGVGFVDAS
jgi:hypothetical protein